MRSGRLQRFATVVAGLTAAALVVTSPSFAARPGGGTLESASAAVLWSGTVERAPGSSEEAVRSDRFALMVRLPRSARQGRRGLQVAIRWPDEADNLRLRVYRKGQLVASSPNLSSTAQSVLIPRPANGRYVVEVDIGPIFGNRSVRYEGLAEVESAPAPAPSRLLLPDLVARRQRNATFRTPPPIFFEPPAAAGQSCFPTEIAEQGAQTCLRFDQIVANRGAGPLQMRLAVPSDPASPERRTIQRIFRSSGGPAAFEERPAGTWTFHAAHNHYHYEAFAISRLWRAGRSGAIAGPRPVAAGRKVGFCITDIEIDAWARKGDGPRTYTFPQCLIPVDQDARAAYLVQGITPGWADVYDWFLPDQFIEVTGVPDGVYVLQTIADPDNRIREADERNNCTSVLVRLSRTATASPRARIVRPRPRC